MEVKSGMHESHDFSGILGSNESRPKPLYFQGCWCHLGEAHHWKNFEHEYSVKESYVHSILSPVPRYIQCLFSQQHSALGMIIKKTILEYLITDTSLTDIELTKMDTSYSLSITHHIIGSRKLIEWTNGWAKIKLHWSYADDGEHHMILL